MKNFKDEEIVIQLSHIKDNIDTENGKTFNINITVNKQIIIKQCDLKELYENMKYYQNLNKTTSIKYIIDKSVIQYFIDEGGKNILFRTWVMICNSDFEIMTQGETANE